MSISTTNIDDLPSKNDEGVVMSSNNVNQTNTPNNIYKTSAKHRVASNNLSIW